MKELNNLYQTISERKANPQPGSYTSYLFDKGLEKILKKYGEESTEVIIASLGNDDEELVGEIADMLYHLLVLMAQKEITLQRVNDKLVERSKKTGNLKPERKEIENL